MTTARVIIGFIAFVCGTVCAIASTFVLYDMLDLVNEKLPKERQFGYLGWYWGKYLRLFENYKKFYPEGQLHRTCLKLAVTMLICLVVIFVFGMKINLK